MWCPHLEVPTLRGVVPMDLGCLRQVQEHQAIRYGVRGQIWRTEGRSLDLALYGTRPHCAQPMAGAS